MYNLILVTFYEAETQLLNIFVHVKEERKEGFLICFHLTPSGWFFTNDGHGIVRRGQDNKDPISCYLEKQAHHSVGLNSPKLQ